ncbi:MAG: pectate lyase [Luteolibacter sp.]|uniref:pectate lyase n=1 Tax=Luteolibacter sp. TaxID=1962973 RepID=UPI0032662A9B
MIQLNPRIARSLCTLFALTSASVFAEPITPSRVNELPPAEQAAWKTYLEKSQTSALAEQVALQAEVTANSLPKALRAPSGGDFKLKFEAGDPWFGGEEAKVLADSILSFQTPTGGWSKHLGFADGTRKPGMQWTSQSEPGEPFHYAATFDNHSTTAEMDLVAGVWLATKREDCKQAFVRGLNFILAAQYPNGGWPQVYPLEGVYHDDITFNDDAMTLVLRQLHGITLNQPCYAFLDEPQRQQAAAALAKGIDCVLKTQVMQNGSKTVWCAQIDPLTLQPSSARKMEPATLSGLESAKLLKFLMEIPSPSPEMVTCIDGGLKWFGEAKIADPPSSEVRWARFYDLKTGKPVFPGRDGVLYETFEAMAAKNKLGYDFYTTLPGSIVSNSQKKWRKMLASQAAR